MNNRKEGFGSPPLGAEQQQPQYKSHDNIVRALRERIQTIEAGVVLEKPVPPSYWLRRDLYSKDQCSPYKSEKQEFFKTLAVTWDLLIYERDLEPGSADENIAGIKISQAYKKNPTITLNETQVRLIDAMAEVAGIPHPKGQREIPIPEKFADLNQLRSSPEYQRRAAAYDKRLAREAAAYRRRR